MQNLPERNWIAEIRACFVFVRDNIRYTLDPDEVELVQDPEYTLEHRWGDCDDQVTLLASLLTSIGHPCRFVAIGYTPNEYAHVFLETRGGDETNWIACDPTEQVPLGWRPPPPYATKPMVFHIAQG